MAYTIITTTNARRDIQDAIDWENMRKSGLANYFLADLEQKILAVADSPYICNVRYENVRCAITSVFSYLIHYAIDDTQKQIYILRVLHTSRKPIW